MYVFIILNIHVVLWLVVSWLLAFWRIISFNWHFCPENGGGMLVAGLHVIMTRRSQYETEASFTSTPVLLFENMMLRRIVLLTFTCVVVPIRIVVCNFHFRRGRGR
jgi:hypothetical protein